MSRPSLDPRVFLQLLQARNEAQGRARPDCPPFPLRLPAAGSEDIDYVYDSDDDEKYGRSRRYRCSGWTVAGPYANIPADAAKSANPMVPLKFEQQPGQWQCYEPIATEAHGLHHYQSHFVSSEVMRAHETALRAHTCDNWQDAVQMAHQALSISPICPEAYNVLAVAQANSYEEALEHYSKAVELGPKMLKAAKFSEVVESHKVWRCVPLRAYYRGMYGVANTLRKMGRYSESLAAYDKLLAADPLWYSWSSYVNVMALYPFVLLGAKGPKAVLDYIESFSGSADQFSYISSSIYWTGAYVLADLLHTEAEGVSVRAGGAKVTPEDGWAADGLEVQDFNMGDHSMSYRGVQRRPLACLCHTYFEAVDMLLGDRAIPAGVKPFNSAVHKHDQATAFAYTTRAQWRCHFTVMQRLRRYRNTYEVRALIQDLRNPDLSIDMQDLKRYMTDVGGFHTGALEKESSARQRVRSLINILMDYPNGKSFLKDENQALKWLLGAGVPVNVEHPNQPKDQPLQMACYQSYGIDAVKLLLAAGADPLSPNEQGLTALAMTANQGNYREMQVILQTLPHLYTANAAEVGYCAREGFQKWTQKLTVPEALLLDLFKSSVLPCLAGDGPCMRCGEMGVPHNRFANFFEFAERVVLQADLRRLSKTLTDEMSRCARGAGPGSPWYKLNKHVLRVVEKNKKAPVCTQQPAAAAGSAVPLAAAAAGLAGSSSGSTSKAAAAAAAGAAAAAANSSGVVNPNAVDGCGRGCCSGGNSSSSSSSNSSGRSSSRSRSKNNHNMLAGAGKEGALDTQPAAVQPDQTAREQSAAAAAATTAAVAPSAAATAQRQCYECGVQSGGDLTLKKCSGCRTAYYCSRSCQEAAWKGHKADCKKWAAERAAAKAQKVR